MIDFKTFTIDVSRRYVEDCNSLIDSGMRNTILGWLRAREIAKLSSCVDHFPEAYQSPDQIRFLRQVAAFFKKNVAFSDPSVCTPAAQSAFERAEKLCRITNRRLDHFFAYQDRIDPELRSDVLRAESIVRDVLGDIGTYYEMVTSLIRVTPGATSTLSRREALPPLKLRVKELPATLSAQPYLRVIASHFGYDNVSFKTVRTNRVETVPKNWKTDRTIACEPTGNLSLQLTLDSYIKMRLKRKLGINLSDQSENQRLALQGSLDDSLSTIDLSMASDTMSYNCVAWLLPFQWFKFCCAARSPYGKGFGRLYKYAKFSSMGNGATFTLETLVFAAFCKSVGSTGFNVYGDDIIIETEHVERLKRLMRFFGFLVNHEKSFTSGPFRESCGTDWFAGIDVTPIYLRSGAKLKSEDCHNVNTLASICSPGGTLEEYLVDYTLTRDLPFVPFTENSTSGVWVTPSSAYATKAIRNNRGVLQFKAYTPHSVNRLVDDSRSLFLWHLDAARRGNKKHPIDEPYTFRQWVLDPIRAKSITHQPCIIRSRVPVFTHKYKRKWVCWFPPTVATPSHLFRWSDTLIRRKAEMSSRG